MTKKIGVKDLKKHLKDKPEKELIEEVVELYKRFSNVKDYYASVLNPASSIDVLATYKDKIANEFFPKRGYGNAKLSVTRKAINDYKKVAPSPEHIIDLLLHLVEQGSAFTNEYGDINEAFYESLENTFASALKLMVAQNSIEHFDERCQDIVKSAFEGWGFSDMLSQHYDEYIVERNT